MKLFLIIAVVAAIYWHTELNNFLNSGSTQSPGPNATKPDKVLPTKEDKSWTKWLVEHTPRK